MRTTRLAFVVLTAAIVLFPPWGRPRSYDPELGHYGGELIGLAPFFAPPTLKHGGAVTIAWGTLALELTAAAAVTFGVAWALRKE